MKIKQIVFSPTGGTQKVVDILTAGWGSAAEQVDLAAPQTDYDISFAQDDVAVIAAPSFSGRVPAHAAEKIAKLDGGGARCVLVCVYGNRAYEDTLAELQDIAEKSNFRVVAAVAAVAEHSIARQYAAGRPDAEDKTELTAFAEQIWQKITAGFDAVPAIPGNRPYRKAGGGGLVPKADKNCTACCKCAEECPTRAINRADIKTADGDKCISCMRCVAVCPESARSVSKAMAAVVAAKLKKVCEVRKSCELYL